MGHLPFLHPFASTQCIAKKTVRNGISHAMENGKHSSDNVFRRVAVKVSLHKKTTQTNKPIQIPQFAAFIIARGCYSFNLVDTHEKLHNYNLPINSKQLFNKLVLAADKK